MKLDQLRKVIREEVRAAVKEELQEVMNEAVKVASTPTSMQPAPVAGTTSWSAPKEEKKPSRQELAELMGIPAPPKTTNLNFTGKDPLQEMLNMTKQSMTGEDYGNVINADSTMVNKPSLATQQAANMGMSSVEGMQGSLDISQLGFVKNAKKVLDLANQKSSGQLT